MFLKYDLFLLLDRDKCSHLFFQTQFTFLFHFFSGRDQNYQEIHFSLFRVSLR